MNNNSNTNNSIKDNKSFNRAVMSLVIPMALQNLVNVGVTATDVIMLGFVGEKSLSGASLGGQIQFIMTLIFFGLTSGASVLVAQYWGKGDVPTIEKILGISIKITLGVGLIFFVGGFFFSKQLMFLLSNDVQVIEEGAKYIKIVSCSYMITGLTMVYLNTLRSVEKVLISTFVYFASLITNIIFNSIFIFGLFGWPAMGTAGAALGTVIARIVELLIVIFYDRRINKIFKFRLKMLFVRDKVILGDFMKFSMPVVANELMWGSGVATIAAILGHMGSAASAANSVAQVVRQLATVISFGVANATAIMVGKAIGEGKFEVAKEYAKRLMRISLITGILGTAVILMARPLVLANMTMTEEATKYLSAMLFVMAYFVIGQSLNTTFVVGVFRAGGDTKFGLFIDVTFMWAVSIVCGALAAFVFHLSVPIVYMILLSDEIIKLPFTISRYKSYRWMKNVTR